MKPTPKTAMPDASKVLVYINSDGAARELTEADKKYVDTEFSPFDGGRPYIKSHYEERNGWGELGGYLHRKEVPNGIPIGAAPPDEPQETTPHAVASSILELVQKYKPDGEHKLRFKVPLSRDTTKD